jgi:hypothetical protein
MSNSSDQLEEIKLQISSDSRANKCFAYSTLLHFQEQSSDDPASIQALAGLSQSLLSLFVADISDDDEEMSVPNKFVKTFYINTFLFIFCW